MLQASEATGLTDFGDNSFRVGLDKLVEAINTESEPNEMGKVVFPGSIIGHLVNRLQVEDWYTRHPEIDNEIIRDPVFITGLPRTGSTVLGHMLALDPDSRCLRGWEAKSPCPPPDIKLQDDPRIAENQEREAQMDALAPGISEALPRNSNAPEECFTLLDLSFADIAANAFYHVPSFERWVIQENLAEVDAAYQYHRRVLKLLQWKTPAKRWVLRSPVHGLALTALLKSYPDARFIITHRWPDKVLPSISSLVHQVKELFLEDPHPELLGPSMLDQWSEATQRIMRVRENMDEHRFFDIYHSEQIVNPELGLRALYEWLGWNFSEDFLTRLNAWRVENPKGRHKPDPALFNLDLDEVKQRFTFYTRKFGQRM
jgi:hypothetical protein